MLLRAGLLSLALLLASRLGERERNLWIAEYALQMAEDGVLGFFE